MSAIKNLAVLGAATAAASGLGYYGQEISEAVGGMESLPESVREGLASGIEYMSKNFNNIGQTISEATQLDGVMANDRLRNAIVAGTSILGVSAAATALLGGFSGENTPTGGIPYAPGSGPERS